jgi:hypothetical protein
MTPSDIVLLGLVAAIATWVSYRLLWRRRRAGAVDSPAPLHPSTLDTVAAIYRLTYTDPEQERADRVAAGLDAPIAESEGIEIPTPWIEARRRAIPARFVDRVHAYLGSPLPPRVPLEAMMHEKAATPDPDAGAVFPLEEEAAPAPGTCGIYEVITTRADANNFREGMEVELDEYTFREGAGISILEPPPGSDAPARAWHGDREIPVEEAWRMVGGGSQYVVAAAPEDAQRELAELRAALESDCNATAIAGITPGKGHPLTAHVARLQARLRLDHDEKCSVVVSNLHDARNRLADLSAALLAACAELEQHNADLRQPGQHITGDAAIATWRELARANGAGGTIP